MWDSYPSSYREAEVQRILRAARAGESSALVGLSGAGKSNVLGFVAHRSVEPKVRFVLVDCNRLPSPEPDALFALMLKALGELAHARPYEALEQALSGIMADAAAKPQLCFLLDRFDALGANAPFGNLRALRDAFKYRLSYVLGLRRPLDARNELAELVQGNTIWLGPLSDADARWSIQQFAARQSLAWSRETEDIIIARSGRYPSFLRGVCQDVANGTLGGLQARVDEFMLDAPTPADLVHSGLADSPVLGGVTSKPAVLFDTGRLTAKEHALLSYFQAHAHGVCEKDDIIRSVWGEDKAFVQGMRDDSLSQLVRRLREKIEPDAANPRHVLTIAGRGYRFAP